MSAGSHVLTADLLTREIEVTFLECLGRDTAASAWMTVQRRDAEILTLIRRRLPTARLNMPDLLAAARTSPAITCRDAPPEVVDGQLSRHVLLCQPRKLPGVTAAATQADFARLAGQFRDARQQPAASVSPQDLTLKAALPTGKSLAGQPARFQGTLTVGNTGYGSQVDVQVLRVTCPPWLDATVSGRHVTLHAHPDFNGCYRGPVTVHTTAGPVTATVTSWHWVCPPFTDDPVSWRALVTRHAHLDEDGAARMVEAHLTAAGYRPLAGGFFALGNHAPQTDRGVSGPVTLSWTVTDHYVETARLPAAGHAPLVRLYAPDGADRYDVPFDGQALHGAALAELFLMWDVTPGRALHLTPYRGHYQFSVHRAGTWLRADATAYQVVATLAALHRTPHFWNQLEDWLSAAPVQLLVQGSETGLLRELLGRFPGHLQVRVTSQPTGESRLYLTAEDGAVSTHGLPDGQSLQRGEWPQELWEQAIPLEQNGRTAPVPDSTSPRPANATVGPAAPAHPPTLAPYEPWDGPVAPPLSSPPSRILQSVQAILQVEGPMVGHHLYARYHAAARSLTGQAAASPTQLKRVLNPLLYSATQRGDLVAEDEFGSGGQIGLVYRLPGQPTRPRLRGDRPLHGIPDSEFRTVIAALPDRQAQAPEIEQIAWVLEQFGFGRFIDGGVERLRPLLRERTAAPAPTQPGQRRRVR